MTHGSLFSGIGGFDLAAQWAGIENKWQVEIDDFCQKVLTKNFPNTKKYRNIYEVGKRELESVDIITGGFPCQPFSQAGKRKGTKDDRYLWDEMFRIITELKPTFVIGENVAGLITMENGKTLDRILTDLENAGYRQETFLIPACSVGAWHRRDRVWIIAYRKSDRWEINKNEKQKLENRNNKDREIGKNKQRRDKMGGFPGRHGHNKPKDVPDTEVKRLQRGKQANNNKGQKCYDKQSDGCNREWYKPGEQWEAEPNVGRVAHGVPRRVDRLEGLGNAIVPYAAYIFFEMIINSHKTKGDLL